MTENRDLRLERTAIRAQGVGCHSHTLDYRISVANSSQSISGWTISGEKLINSVSRYLGGQRSNVFPLWLHCSDQCLCRCVI